MDKKSTGFIRNFAFLNTSRRKREKLIDDVEKFLADSAEDLAPMECAKEPPCVKEKALPKAGVKPSSGKRIRKIGRNSMKKHGEDLSKQQEDFVGNTRSAGLNVKPTTSLLCWKVQQEDSDDASSDAHENQQKGKFYELITEDLGKHQQFLILHAETHQTRASLTMQSNLENCRQSAKGTDQNSWQAPVNSRALAKPNRTAHTMKITTIENDPKRQPVDEPLCVKVHCQRHKGIKFCSSFVINAKPFRLPAEEPEDPSPGSPEEQNQAQEDVGRGSNPRNIHHYVNYDNCSEEDTRIETER